MSMRKAIKPYLVLFFGIAAFVALAEKEFGLPRRWVGWVFIGLALGVHLLIGAVNRSSDTDQYYTAGRRVPALFNGMATASQWISAASFLSLAGVLAATGFGGLAYGMGWVGGYLVFAVCLGPYLRQFGRYTIPNFLQARYPGATAREVGVLAAILVAFTYLVAQLVGIGVIASRFVGIDFDLAIWVGLGAVLLCAAFGGTRSAAWLHVVQYLIVIVAYLAPLVVLSFRLFGDPVPQLTYGRLLQSNSARAVRIAADPREKATRAAWAAEAEALRARIEAPATPRAEVAALSAARRTAVAQARAPAREGARLEDQLAAPRGKALWNFLALVLCLVAGTASLPHTLTHYYTTASARQARTSIGWSLFFIALLYFTAPAYAAFARAALLEHLVGARISELPPWVAQWAPTGLFAVVDRLGDGVVELADVVVKSTDFVVLATPEMAGLPFALSGLLLAGGLLATLSTAEALLVTIANTASHDLYYNVIHRHASLMNRLTMERIVLIVAAVAAAQVATLRLGTIVEMVAWAFSLAGAAFFPALVMGVWWKRANRLGAVAGMVSGLGVTAFYAVASRGFGLSWFGTETVASGVFGIVVGFAAIAIVSLLTAAPPKEMQEFVAGMRYPSPPGGASPRSAPRAAEIDRRSGSA